MAALMKLLVQFVGRDRDRAGETLAGAASPAGGAVPHETREPTRSTRSTSLPTRRAPRRDDSAKRVSGGSRCPPRVRRATWSRGRASWSMTGKPLIRCGGCLAPRACARHRHRTFPRPGTHAFIRRFQAASGASLTSRTAPTTRRAEPSRSSLPASRASVAAASARAMSACRCRFCPLSSLPAFGRTP